MSEKTTFILSKTTPNDVLFYLHPISNTSLTRLVYLTKKSPKIALPLDWALGVLFDVEAYSLYKSGFIAFDDNEEIARQGMEHGVYFDDKLEFTPAKPTSESEIVVILKKGIRNEVLDAITRYGKDLVKDVAIAHADEFTAGILTLLEKELNIQLIMNEM